MGRQKQVEKKKKKELKGKFLSITYNRRENSQMQQTKSAEEGLSLGVRKCLHTQQAHRKGPLQSKGWIWESENPASPQGLEVLQDLRCLPFLT